jgi:membrane fusion protein, multidrug efflux system
VLASLWTAYASAVLPRPCYRPPQNALSKVSCNAVPASNIPNPVRYFIAVLALLTIVAALAGVKAAQISTLVNMGKQAQKTGPPPESISTTVAQKQTWEDSLSAVGSITAARGVNVSNEVAGTVSRILFESGATVKEGQVLVELDTSVERAQLATSRARLELARVTARRTRALVATSSISQAQADSDESQLKTSVTDADALEAQIARKTIRAPFAGRLGIRLINRGQYLASGTPITTLEAIETVYVDFTLPQQRLPDVSVGMPVRVTLENSAVPQDGVVAAIDPAVDSTTRTIRLRASIPNTQERLTPGMFARVEVVLPKTSDVVAVPATAIVHAPYGDSVFVVEDKKDEDDHAVIAPNGQPMKVARQQFVRLGDERGDFVAIVDGVTEGQGVVAAGAFKLRNGSNLTVNNSVGAAPQLSPHPPNR